MPDVVRCKAWGIGCEASRIALAFAGNAKGFGCKVVC